MFQKIMKIRIDELAVYLVVPIIGFIFGSILIAGLLYMNGTEETAIPLGTIMAIGTGIMTSIIVGIYNISHLFRLVVGFGVSRKNFFIYDVLVSFILNAILAAVIIVLNVVEEIIQKNIYSAKSVRMEIGLFQYLPWIFLIILCVAVIRELLGAFIFKYGKKALGFMWIAFMICCIVPPKLAEYVSEQKRGVLVEFYNSISEGVLKLGTESYGIIGVVFIIVGLGISWLVIRKQAVQG